MKTALALAFENAQKAPVRLKKAGKVDINLHREKKKPAKVSQSISDYVVNRSSESPEHWEGRKQRLLGHKSKVVPEAIKVSRLYQSIRGQSENVEKHMNMMRPTRQMYPDPIKAHDYADDWTAEKHKVDVNLATAKRAALRAERQRIQAALADFNEDEL